MQSTIERISPIECRVKVEIPWTEVSGRLQNKLRDLRARARLPGFRPGKVPPQVLERRFGRSVRAELADELVQETFQTAVAQHETTALTQPVVEEQSLEKGQPFVYAARFEVPPLIEPKDYTGAPVRRRPAVVDQEKVAAELERRREQQAELRPVPEEEAKEKTRANDVWTIDVEGKIGEQRVSQKDVQITIGKDEGEFIPGLGAALSELTRDRTGGLVHLSFEPPAERLRADLRGQKAELEVGLRDVRIKHLPELDDDLARDTGEAESLAELTKKIEDEIRETDAEEAEFEARRRLLSTLLERNEFEPAPSLLEREVAAQVEQTKRQLAQQGLRLSDVGSSEAQLAQRIRPQALFNVKAFLLLDAIGKKESIDVDEGAFEKELEEMAERSGQNVQRMRATMEKNGQLVLLRAQMREDAILGFLMGKAEVTEAPDPADASDSDEASADEGGADEG